MPGSSQQTSRIANSYLAWQAPDVEIRDRSIEAARLLGALQVDNFKLLRRLVEGTGMRVGAALGCVGWVQGWLLGQH